MNEIGVGGPPVSGGVVYIYIIRRERERERVVYRAFVVWIREREATTKHILYIYSARARGKGWKSVMEVEILNSPVSINNTTVEAI